MGGQAKDESSALTAFDLADIRHRDGVKWFEAPIPPRLHTCTPQTLGFTGGFNYIERCACGSIRLQPFGPWDEKNTRRRDEPVGSLPKPWWSRLAARIARSTP